MTRSYTIDNIRGIAFILMTIYHIFYVCDMTPSNTGEITNYTDNKILDYTGKTSGLSPEFSIPTKVGRKTSGQSPDVSVPTLIGRKTSGLSPEVLIPTKVGRKTDEYR